jgi:hypothetical protein
MADMGIGETMLLSAAIGGGTAAATGGNPLTGALGGAALGGIGGSLLGGAAGDATGMIGQDIASMTTAGASQDAIAQTLMDNYGMNAEQAYNAMGSVASNGANALNAGIGIAGNTSAAGSGIADNTSAAGSGTAGSGSVGPSSGVTGSNLSNPSFMNNPIGWMQANPVKTALAGAGIYGLANALKGGALTKPNSLPTYTPVSASQMGLGRTLSSNYAPQMNYMYNAGYASGGGISVAPGSVASSGIAPADLLNQPSSGITALANQYGVTPSQVQQGLSTLKSAGFAAGGSLGGYSDGGQMLKGGGDGMSDSIPATIDDKQPARLADGEFVVPADVVSHLGNGSTDAGAKQLYSMMDKVRQARTGRKSQGKQIKAGKYLPT